MTYAKRGRLLHVRRNAVLRDRARPERKLENLHATWSRSHVVRLVDHHRSQAECRQHFRQLRFRSSQHVRIWVPNNLFNEVATQKAGGHSLGRGGVDSEGERLALEVQNFSCA